MMIFEDGALTLFKSSLYETVSTVIQTPDLVLAADPSWLPGEVEEIRQYVEKVRAGRRLILLFTHSDYDHIIGWKAFPDAFTIAGRAFQEKGPDRREEILEQIRTFDDEYYISRDYGIAYPEVDFAPERDGDSFAAGDTRLVFYQAPGHNDDGIFTVVEPLGLLIAGDYFSDIEFPFIDHSSALYEETLHKLDTIMERHSLRGLLPGHGNAAWSHEEMKRRQGESFDYIHKMRDAVSRKDQAAIDRCIEGCLFPRNMRKFHHMNRLLFEKELL